MAIVTPHQSQAGIATANAGQAAPYRSASAFMTPGQAALPSGLNQLARGAEKLGDAVFRAGLDRMRLQNATDLLADKVAYEDALRQFDSDYRKNHLGASARDAEEAYAAFHQEQYDKLQKKWGGNKFLMEGVNRMAEGIRLPSMQKAVNYRDGQEEAYKKSVLQSSQAQTFALLGDPNISEEEKRNALDAEESNLRMFAGQQAVQENGRTVWRGGRDMGAEIMALRQKASAVNVEGFLARQDVAGAQRALDVASGALGSLAMAHESGGDPGTISRDTGGSKSYGLFQFNNMGGKGTANSFVAALKTTHPALYEALGGGKYAVGSEEFDKAFRQAASGPLRSEFAQAQREHLERQYQQPIMDRLKGSELTNAFGDNPAMREVMLSTAIQHGPAGANRILREAWGKVDKDADKQVQLEQFITATYQLRGRPGEFKTALAEQKDEAGRARLLASIHGRYQKELPQALALARSGPGASLLPAEQARLQGKIDHARREQAQEAGLTAQAFGNHLEYGLEKGDFTAAEKDVVALQSLGFASEAAEFSGRLELARTAHGALNDVSDLPLAEQGAAVHAQLDSMVTPDNAKTATAMRDNVDRALAQKRAAFIKDPAASVAALPAMQGEMPPQERVRRSLELQERMGAGLAFEPRVLPLEQARQLKAAYDRLDAPASRVAWLSELSKTYGPYARQALHEMQVPEQVVTLLPVLGVMNEKSMGLALTALEVKDGDIPGLDKDAKQAAVDAAAENRLLKDVLTLSRTFPANEALRRFGQGMETMLTNYVKLGGNLADFDKAFESAANGECFLMLPRNAAYDVDDVVDATRGVREDLREKLLAGVPAHTQQGRIDRANLSGLIERGVFVSDESGTRVTLIDPQHGRPVVYGDGTPLSFEIAAIVKEGAERKARLRQVADSLDDDMAGLEADL